MTRGGPPHGTHGRYANWGCRCEDCRQAERNHKRGIRTVDTTRPGRPVLEQERRQACLFASDVDFTPPNIHPDDARDLVMVFCDRCSLRGPCLEAGLERGAPDGVWGGFVVKGSRAWLPDAYERVWRRRGRPRKGEAA